MSEKKRHPLAEKYLRPDRLPHASCAGCGIGQIMHYVLIAIDDLVKEDGLDPKKVVWQSGVGCSSRNTYATWKYDCVDAMHGRALAQATALKLVNPELKVIVFTGDGDCLAIGGNHFIHACRRNVPLVVLMSNNMIYGMTGGQVAPTTPTGFTTMTTPYGFVEAPFDGCKVAIASGASYVARWTVLHARQLINSIKKGLRKNGLAYIEVVNQCPTLYGRYCAKIGDPAELLKWIRDRCVPKEVAEKMSEEELREKYKDKYPIFVVGEFLDVERPTILDGYERMVREARR